MDFEQIKAMIDGKSFVVIAYDDSGFQVKYTNSVMEMISVMEIVKQQEINRHCPKV